VAIFSLQPISTAPFAAVPSNGSVFSTNTSLDFETTSSYSAQLAVRDSAGASVSAPVSITVTDVNEPPVFPASVTAGGLTVQKASRAGTSVLQLNARDPEGTEVNPHTCVCFVCALFMLLARP
jgi:hypothetical protein